MAPGVSQLRGLFVPAGRVGARHRWCGSDATFSQFPYWLAENRAGSLMLTMVNLRLSPRRLLGICR